MTQDQRTRAFQRFLVDAKSYWMSEMFPALRRDYETRRRGQAIETPEQVEALLAGTPLNEFFGWFERHIQKQKYSGRWGLAAAAEAARPALAAELGPAGAAPLDLDPDVAVPDYYAAIDTHQHPGNLTGDELAGYVYRDSAMSTQPGSTSGHALHHRFAALVAGHGAFRRIADLGCGFGKSALPLAQRFPDAEIVAFDLSAPCLRLAAVEAGRSQARNISFRQADVCHTGEPAGAYDLVSSTMLLHELTPAAIQDVLAESHRLLAPGGLCVHLDFRANGPFETYIHHGHARRNNEPYMEAFNRMDVATAWRDAGFPDLEVAPFHETDGAIAADNPNWRFPWTLFIARKPPARATAAP